MAKWQSGYSLGAQGFAAAAQKVGTGYLAIHIYVLIVVRYTFHGLHIFLDITDKLIYKVPKINTYIGY